MSKKLLLVLGLMLCGATAGQAQTQSGKTGPWTLQEAIEYAITNNLQVKQNALSRDLSRLDLKQSQLNRVPTINGNTSYSINAGSFQDPVTFQLLTQSAQTGNVSLNANVPLFAGFQQLNTIKQNQLLLQASEQENLSVQNDITIQIVTAYLNILFANELINTSQLQRTLTQEQLNRTGVLFKAGSVAENAVLDLESQLATDELNLITAQNQRDVARLTLMQLLNIPTTESFEVLIPQIPEPDQEPIIVNGDQVYDAAVQILPAIKAANLRLQGAAKGLDVAKGGFYPRINLFGGVGSRYSSASQFLFGREETFNGYLQQSYFEDVAGSNLIRTVFVPSTSYLPVYGDYPLFDQLKDNINRQAGISIQIPIFNGFQVRNNVERAKLSQENARVAADIARNNLRQTIEQAYLDAVASQRRYAAAKQQVLASEKNFRNAELRLNSGVINTVDFNVIANTYRSAQSSLIQAKYEYTFKVKILDFYQGKPLTL
ncbi:TolC family protein [Pontibacter qinzhouensis]|nr:TolC family protein [Pontibacter qinzhouensis]